MKELRKSVWIAAPPEVVFDYFVDSNKMARWCGQQAELDPVPGGLYRLDMGASGVFEGTFLEIDPGKSLSYEVGPRGVETPLARIEVHVTAENGGCRVEVRQTGLAPPFDRVANRGWDHHLSRLSVAAAGGAPGTDPLCQRSLESLT